MAEASSVSVIIPVYNAESYLPDCLQSILEQTYRPLEAVFHDDRSSDGSAALLSDWKPRLEEQQ
jgi:glycosyltransferase EpsH